MNCGAALGPTPAATLTSHPCFWQVQYSDFIQNWSEEYSPSVEADVRAFAPGTFFIHGADHQESRGEQLMRSVDHSWDKR